MNEDRKYRIRSVAALFYNIGIPYQDLGKPVNIAPVCHNTAAAFLKHRLFGKPY